MMVSANSPTMEADRDVKEKFYWRLHDVVRKAHKDVKLFLLDEFNTTSGSKALA